MLRKLSLIVSALMLGLSAGAAAKDAEPIKVGLLYNLTGGLSSLDVPALNGSRLKAKQINEAGGLLGGRRLELIVIDTKTDQQETEKGAQKLLSKDIVAGVGYSDTSFVMAAAPLFQAKGIPFITFGATHPLLPAWVGDHLFMTPFGDDDQSFAIADYTFDQLKARRVAVWTDNSMDFTKALSKYFKERFGDRGGEVAAEDSFMMGDTDFSAQIARLKAVDPAPDAVFISAIPSEAGLTVKQIRETGLDIPIVSGDGFDTELVADVPGPKLANDVYFATHTYRADGREEVLSFVEAYKEAYGKEPENAFAPLGYDAIGLLADAIERANSTQPDKVRDALAATHKFTAVTGEISYTRDTMVPPKPVAIIGVQSGKYDMLEIWNPK